MDEAHAPKTSEAGQSGPILAASRTAFPSFICRRLGAWLGRIGYVPRGVSAGLDQGILWNDRAESGRDLSVALVAWLEASGWVLAGDSAEPGTSDRLAAQPLTSLLPQETGGDRLSLEDDPYPERYVHAFSHPKGRGRLVSIAVPPSQSLTFSQLGGRRAGDSPRNRLRQIVLAHPFSIGVLCNGRDLLWTTYDTSGDWHEVVVTCKRMHAEFSELPFENLSLFDALCAPIVAEQRESMLRELAAHQAAELTELERRLTLAAPHFVDHVLSLPENEEWAETIRQSSSLVTSLWHETMLLTFSLMLAIRTLPEATLVGDEPNCSEGTAGRARLHPVLARLSRSLTSTADTVTPAAVKEFMDYIAQSMSEPGTAPGVDVNLDCQRPESLSLLRRSFIDLPACRILLDAVTRLPHASDGHRSDGTGDCPPLEGIGEFELIHLFETLLELEPHIAYTTMVRLRRGRHEVVVEDAPSSDAPAREPTKILAGKFYVVHTDARKAAGAFYTPRPLARALTSASAEAYLSSRKRPSARMLLRVGILDPAMGVGTFLLESADVFGTLVFNALEDQTTQKSQGSGRTGRLLDAAGTHPSAHKEPLETMSPGPPKTVPPTSKLALPTLRALEASRYQQWRRCKKAFVARGLYGVDLNPVAVAIAKFALFSQTDFDSKVAVKLSKHLVAGNSLTGPRLHQLEETPISRVELSDEHCGELRKLASPLKPMPGSSCGSRPPQHDGDARLLERSGLATNRLQTLAHIWSGAVLQGRADDDDTYVRAIAEQLARSFDEPEEPTKQTVHLAQLGREAICFDLVFPERFNVRGDLARSGFDIVLGNPPWDCVKHDSRSHLAKFDLRARIVPTRRERDALAREVLTTGKRAVEWSAKVESFEGLKRAHDRLYRHQKVIVNGELAGRQLDLFRIFIERSWDLLSQSGVLAQVIPSAFHTAAGATGIRRLMMTTGAMLTYAVFRNTRKWFDVSRELEFGLLVATRMHLEHHELKFSFGLEDPIALLRQRVGWLRLLQERVLENNPYATLPAVRDPQELDTLLRAQDSGRTLAKFMSESNVDLRSTPTSVHRTHEAIHFVDLPSEPDSRLISTDPRLLATYGAVLHEGATFERYDDTWGSSPKYALKISRVRAVPRYSSAVKHYRLVMRAIVGSSKHKCIASMVAPGTLVANSALVESQPWMRPTYQALIAMTVLNSSAASAFLAAYADLNVNLFALRRLPWPRTLPEAFLAHSAMQLVANHAGWAKLLREQVSEGMLDPTKPALFPLVADVSRRQCLRARIDAVVAKAYDLSREQYLSIVRQFPADPVFAQGLAAFDELEELGMDEFCRRHDDYHQIPLVRSLPQATEYDCLRCSEQG